MTDYILHSFMCQDIWVLNNAEWLSASRLQIGDGVTGGNAYREVGDTYNRNWELKIYNSCKRYEGDPVGSDKLIYLDGDDKPIIFRTQRNIADESRTWFIIYDGVIKDQITVEGGIYWCYLSFYALDRIWRVDSVYYYQGIVGGFELSFDYGSKKKPVKFEFKTLGDTKTTKWYFPDWYYTERLGDAIIF